MTATDLDLSRAAWRKSTYSNNGGQCVEVAAVWRKSTYSGNGGQCVEVARGGPYVVAVRDSKDPGGPKLAFAPKEWKAFTNTVKGGAADLLGRYEPRLRLGQVYKGRSRFRERPLRRDELQRRRSRASPPPLPQARPGTAGRTGPRCPNRTSGSPSGDQRLGAAIM